MNNNEPNIDFTTKYEEGILNLMSNLVECVHGDINTRLKLEQDVRTLEKQIDEEIGNRTAKTHIYNMKLLSKLKQTKYDFHNTERGKYPSYDLIVNETTEMLKTINQRINKF